MIDVEQVVYEALSDLGGITVWQVDANPAAGSPPGHFDITTVQVDVRASTKKRTRDRAYEARQRVLDLPGSHPGGVVTATTIQGPQWLADEDGRPRYVLRADVWNHPQTVNA